VFSPPAASRTSLRSADAAQSAASADSAADPHWWASQGHYAGSSIALDAGPSTLGRDHSNVNLVFPPDANAISKRHCRVSWDISRRVFVLEDLGRPTELSWRTGSA
jgi:hypothetical protein